MLADEYLDVLSGFTARMNIAFISQLAECAEETYSHIIQLWNITLAFKYLKL